MVEINTITKIIVKQKNGIECTVGSGFNLDFRNIIQEIKMN